MISYVLNADSGRLADALVSDTLKRKGSKKKTMRPSLSRLSVKPIKNKQNEHPFNGPLPGLLR